MEAWSIKRMISQHGEMDQRINTQVGGDSADDADTASTASRICDILMSSRRLAAASAECREADCEGCRTAIHQIIAARVRTREKIVFVLPAFPAKSPNLAKVLGKLPDMAEWLSLNFLDVLCDRVASIYPAGASVVICSDGRVFGDLIGVADADITGYQIGLRTMLKEIGDRHLQTFNLDDIAYPPGLDHDARRARFIDDWAAPLDDIRQDVRAGGQPVELYRGITRFLFEDSLRPDSGVSRTALQRECRQRAYGMLQRSQAWGAAVMQHFPDAVRLSIHPQVHGSGKFGIHLMETADSWLTPWHGVAVQAGGRFALMKRAQAEAMGGRLIYFQNGQTSHFMVPSSAWRQPLAEAAPGGDPSATDEDDAGTPLMENAQWT